MNSRPIQILVTGLVLAGCDSSGPLVFTDESTTRPTHALAYTSSAFDYDVLYPAWLYLVEPSSGTPKLLVTDSSWFGGITNPQWSPDGTRIAYVRGGEDDATSLWLVDVRSKQRTLLNDDGFQSHSPSWSADGSQIAFISTADHIPSAPGQLVLMDAEAGASVAFRPPMRDAHHPTWSPSGHMLLVAGSSVSVSALDRGNRGVWFLDSDGMEFEPLLITNREIRGIAWSPDGAKIALLLRDDNRTYLRILAADGATLSLVSFPTRYTGPPSWSQDSQRVCLLSERRFNISTIHIVSASGHSNRSYAARLRPGLASWSSDGSRIAYAGWHSINELNPETGESRTLVSDPMAMFADPRWSPIPWSR